jgi:hypothetical protein
MRLIMRHFNEMCEDGNEKKRNQWISRFFFT